MRLEAVDLLMMEGMRAYEDFGPEEFSACESKTGVRREWTVFVQPGADSAFWDVAVVSPAHDPLRFGKGVAEIECGDGFENEVKRIRLVLACGAGEPMQTFGATKHLQGLQTVAPHTFLDGELAGAGGAGRILLSLSGEHFIGLMITREFFAPVRRVDWGCYFQSTRCWRVCQTRVADFAWVGREFFVRRGSRILRCLVEWKWLRRGIFAAWYGVV